MKCVTSVSYKILVIKSPENQIKPTRGLRQGDPISPYLFIICMKGISSNLKKMKSKGNIEGIKIKRDSPIISHLLFEDDCFIFTKTKVKCTKAVYYKKIILLFYNKTL